MDKNAIKKYAVWARTELIDRVRQRAEKYEVAADADPNADSASGTVLSKTEKAQRQAAIRRMREKGYEHVIEEVAYTWFNRFAALRYMEVNNYLPSRVRVFTDENGDFKPQILTEAIHLNLDGLNMETVYAYKEKNQTDELYKYLLITQCNALSAVLPGMFQKISDYTELLLPDNLLREGSVLGQMVEMIAEDNWTDAVEIIGWLYQYYISEKKDEVFAALKKNVKITRENIPAATQLFTPDWIVKYMVENSLGRLWLERHPDSNLRAGWKYYLDEAEQTPEVRAQLDALVAQNPINKPEDIKLIDPCMGSGHILVYAFDVLFQIYQSVGYAERDIPDLILEHNIYGLDIDERACQLAYFALMMKARSYNRSFLRRDNVPQPQVYSPQGYEDGMEYGSLVKVDELEEKPQEAAGQIELSDMDYTQRLNTWNFRRLLYQKYYVVVTNPPYMGSSGMGAKLGDYVKKNYPDSKSDMFAVFIEKCGELLNANGYQAMITQHAWMFLSSYEKLRAKLMRRSIINMAHLGARAFEEIGGEVVQTTAFVMAKRHTADYAAPYARLVDFNSQQAKEDAFLSGGSRHIANQEVFEKIPGEPIAYWAGRGISEAFINGAQLGTLAIARNGMKTGDNDRFIRLWWEVSNSKSKTDAQTAEIAISSKAKWFPYNKGGEARKWYGNNDYVVNWENGGAEVIEHAKADGRNVQDYPLAMKFRPSATWSLINTGIPTFRYKECNISDIAGMSFYNAGSSTKYYLAFCNTPIASSILQLLAPTINYQAGDIGRLPIIREEGWENEVTQIVDKNIAHAKSDWDSFETSWDFQTHPLISGEKTVAAAFNKWQQEAETRFTTLKANEEELNRIFIDIYGLQDELTPEVEDRDVTVRRADLGREIRSLISYAVGCMFGRYSLDTSGLAYAGGEWDASKYTTFPADKDNILPICDDEYFDDDLTGLFVKFVKTVYGEDTLDENLKFIADALGGKGSPKDVIRDYFLSEKGFYADHCKIYQKRPIYWLFDSGKKNGFKALVYMHRYQPDTIARMRTDYVHEQQSRYRTAIADLENRIAGASASERVQLNKQLIKLKDQSVEIHGYEEKIHHLADRMISIDLDDGVKHNYEIFKDVLTKIK